MLKTLFAITAVGTVVALSMNLEEVEKPITPVKLETPAKNYSTYCSGCHGEKMDMFVDRQWKFGNKKEDIAKSIKLGHEPEGMPAFGETLNDKDISALADYILSGIQNVGKYTGNDKPISDIFKTEAMTIKLELVAEGLDIPWGFTFLPDGDILTTDKNGKIYRVKKDKSKQEVSGGPEPLVRGQGGLLDVALDPDFAKNNFVYFSYSKFKNEGRLLATTAIMKAKLSGNQLTEQKDIFVAEPWQTTQHHYGSRMQFGKDGYLYFSVGERGNEKANPQTIKENDLGKIHRIKSDGGIPTDNPFVKSGAGEASIYSYGNRNPQGLVIHPLTGKLWETEHGPRGGDEINIIEPGKNYGWPVITYGINYNGKPITNISAKAGMEQPIHYWIPSIGPSGMAFVTGTKYKGWEGNLMCGSLRFQFLQRVILNGNKVTKQEILFKNIGRVRDVRMAPDGYLYMAVESPGRIFKLVPTN